MLDSRSGLLIVVVVFGVVREISRVSVAFLNTNEIGLVATHMCLEVALIVLEARHVVWSRKQTLRVKCVTRPWLRYELGVGRH